MATPEGAVKEQIKKWAKKNDIWLFMPVPSAFGATVGMSDFLGMLPDSGFLAIEAKAPGKKKNVTANQQKFIDKVNSGGGIAVVVDSQEDLDVLDKLIAERSA